MTKAVTSVRDWWGGSRARSMVVLVRLAFDVHAGLMAALLVMALLDALLPVASLAVVGGLVGALVHKDPVAPWLVAFGALHLLPIGELRWRVGDVIGYRVGERLDQRVMRALLEPAGVAHLEDAEVQDQASRAATFWNSSVLDMSLNVVVVRVSGFMSVALLARVAGWTVALALTLAWVLAGRWSWRQARSALDVHFDQMAELRHAEYASELALAPSAAKELRIYGLGEWIATRYLRLWTTAMAEVWRARGRAIGPSVIVAAVVTAVNGATFLRLGHLALDGRLSAAALAIGIQAALGASDVGAMAYGHYEMEYGLRAIPANEGLARLVLDAKFRLPGAAPADGLPSEAIRFEGVSFAYAGSERPVLSELDLEIPAGRALAIVGDNGAGKTTLVKLLCRFYDPTEGAVTVDGLDLRTFDPDGWHRRVAGLFQDFVRYPLSVRDNLAMSADVDERVLLDAATKAGIDDVLADLADGWDTQLTRQFLGGVDLSGGQWQRVALARALIAVRTGAGVLVLDEPTAQLDARAEANFYDRFLELTEGTTTVLISHRFSTVRRAGAIAVLDGGRVVELGSHDELLALDGKYARMFRLQASRFSDA